MEFRQAAWGDRMTFNPNFRFGHRRRYTRDIEISRALVADYKGIPNKDELAELLRQAVINTGGKTVRGNDEVPRDASSEDHVQRKAPLAGNPKPPR